MEIKIVVREEYEKGVVKKEIEHNCELIKKILKFKGKRNWGNVRLNEEDVVKKEIEDDCKLIRKIMKMSGK